MNEMIINFYNIIHLLLAGLCLEFIFLQIAKFRKERDEKGYLMCAFVGLNGFLYSIIEALISQETPLLFGEFLTKFQYTQLAFYPIFMSLFWFYFLNEERFKKISRIFIILAPIFILSIWFSPFHQYGEYTLNIYNKDTLIEIYQWDYPEVGLFFFLQIFSFLFSNLLIAVYLLRTPTTYIDKEKKYFVVAVLFHYFAMFNDIMVILEVYQMYYLTGVATFTLIYTLNYFLAVKHYNVEASLRESEEKFRDVVEHANDGICVVQLSYIQYINPQVTELIGYNAEEMIDTEYLKYIYPELLQRVKKQYEEFISQEEEIERFETALLHKDGRRIDVEITASLTTYRGQPATLIFIRDIIKRKRAEAIIKDEVEKLKEIDQIRKDLISRVSHELKTPLSAISGAIELLLNIYFNQIGDEPLDLIKMIERAGDRLGSLVENLLDISRLEYSKFQLKKEKKDLAKITRTCCNDMNHIAKERGISFNLELPDFLNLEVDNIRIEQVINNLLSNAIKNTPPNGEIKIMLRQRDEWAELSISDTGIGLIDDEMDKLFTRFGKIERYGKGLEFLNIQGSGLGLYISKSIVDLHGGQIKAESDGRHKGASFMVRLPFSP